MELYKKFGGKAKKAYRSCTSDSIVKYSRLKECVEPKGDHTSPASSKRREGENQTDDESKAEEEYFCDTEAVLKEDNKDKEIGEEKAMCLVGF